MACAAYAACRRAAQRALRAKRYAYLPHALIFSVAGGCYVAYAMRVYMLLMSMPCHCYTCAVDAGARRAFIICAIVTLA